MMALDCALGLCPDFYKMDIGFHASPTVKVKAALRMDDPLIRTKGEVKLFTSSSHNACLLRSLNTFRQEGKFCDVEIVVGSLIIKAHRAVLSASSPYFLAMFSNGLAEEFKNKIEMHSLSESILSLIIEFMYSGTITITETNIQELMVAADMLEVSEIVEGCAQFLKDQLHVSNAIGIYRFAETHNWVDLMNTSQNFINENFPEVCVEDEFHELPKNLLLKFLSSESLKVDSEYQVFSAALSWINHNLSLRREFVFDILSLVRLSLIPSHLIQQTIDKCKDMSLVVALNAIKRDLVSGKGNLVSLTAQPRLSAKKDIYVIGGVKREVFSSWNRCTECPYHSVAKYDTFTKTWSLSVPMKVNRVLPGVAILNGLIYVIGGEQGSNNCQVLSDGECYDPHANAWSPVSRMLAPRCEFGLSAMNGYLYALGGWEGDDIGDKIERYDPVSREWKVHGNLPFPRFSMGVVSYKGLIYCVGGCSTNTRRLQDLSSYDPETSKWTPLAEMSVPRSQMGVAILDDFLYVVGGMSINQDVLESVERYSFKENKWSLVPPMAHGRASPAVVAADGNLYVIGGDQPHVVNFYRAHLTVSHVERYCPSTNTWEECCPLPESRSEARAVAL
ncbi:unnamed protein product [Bemisia tabaci]|uniref:Kelch-like protein diablo n=2 Tax=Bemisia tabaci TaxID=7038 RepID=A0A9P0AL45_BEMTA|nr:unnamed protein product [Bemisia tabaci]